MELQRPDLKQVDPEVLAYIKALEAELERLRQGSRSRSRSSVSTGEDDGILAAITETEEPPTTQNLITATASGTLKRTPRHLYHRQNRGGMGVFDLEVPRDEAPALLAVADESETLLAITSHARAYRLPVSALPQSEVHDRGTSFAARFELQDGETLAVLLPIQAQGYLAMVSKRGYYRILRHHVFGEHMKAGTSLYDLKTFGPLAAACWTPGDGDLFIATRQGKGIRFAEKNLPPGGGLGIRLSDGDEAVAIAPVTEDSGVFLISASGKGAIRLMSGFSANKSPGAAGKIALNTDRLAAAAAVESGDDIFLISRLSKIIRFPAEQVPPKEGVVQGVICMSLRSDEVAALAVSPAYPRL